MTDSQIRFEDGAAYEHMMGRWSVLAGARFLDWTGVPPGARWLDVGCGNGAFTELLLQRQRPSDVKAIDPSPGQLDYARKRLPAGAPVTWLQGDAMQLPVDAGQFDAAVMALVLFFVPEPAVGIAQMCRAVRPGGIVAAYHWDILGGGFPLAAIGIEMRELGIAPTLPPSVAASTLEASLALWRQARLADVRTTQFTVQRVFDSFEDYWRSAASSNTVRRAFETLRPEQLSLLEDKVRVRLRATEGPLTVSARANAVCGVRA